MEETWSINVVIYVEVNDIKEPERKIKISPLVISIFEKYIQKRLWLIGSWWNNNR